MKVTVYIVSLIVSFSLFSEKLNAQLSTKGTDFWFSCGQNRTHAYNLVNLQYRVVAEEPNTVVTFEYIYNPGSLNHTMNIAAPGVYNYAADGNHKRAIYPTNTTAETNGIGNKSVHVTSTKPIYLYVLNQYNITTDATNILPVSSLGTDYYHISYEASGSWRDGYTLVATENGTNFWEDGVLIAANMNRGQVYYRWPHAKFRSQDQTGLHITSNKPVAYFVTNSGVFIPTYLHNGADILYQQFMPVNTWGRRFMVPVTHRGMVRTRVLASQDNTSVDFVGGTVVEDNGGYSKHVVGPPPYTLDAGEFIEIHTALVYDNGTFIEADKPVAVCSYIMGRDERNEDEDLIGDNDKGDPSIVWVPPIEQAVRSILAAPFIPTGSSQIDYHRALIVTPTATKTSTTLKLNGVTQLLPGTWYDHPSGYSFYNYAFNGSDAASAWPYLFENSAGLVLLCYGFGSYESYYYFAGAAARDLDLAFYYTNPGISDTIHHQDLEGMAFCDTIAHFNAVVQYAMSTASGYLKWFIDNVEQTAVRDSLSWWTTSLSPGVHTVELVVLGLNGNIGTASSTFTISAPEINTITDMICLGAEEYHKYGFDETFQQTGMIYDTLYLKNQYDCDSIVRLELTVLPVYDTLIIDTICLGDTYTNPTYAFLDTTPTVPGLIAVDTTLYTIIGGCDSIVRLELTVLPVYDTLIIDTICFGDTYTNTTYAFLDTTPTATGLISVDTTLHTIIGGCDSTVRLNLTVLPVYDTLVTDTICFGDTYINPVYAFLDTTPTAPGLIAWDTTLYTIIGGCDSIVRLELTVLPVYDTLIIDTICLGDTYTNSTYAFLDTTPTAPGLIAWDTTLYTVIGGCDSTVSLNLIVNPSYDIIINASVCEDDSYNANGFNISVAQPGFYTYTHSLKTTDCDCDSIVTLQLAVNPVYDEYIFAQIYEDEFYRVGNYQYNTPGLHVSNLKTEEGCDSIVTLNLDVIYYPFITAFSPFNKDGINDYFMPGFRVQVFNRYGTPVYETRTQEEQDKGWDGRSSNGQNVEPGLYFYILYNSSGKPRLKSSLEILKR
ncbi:MAG: gliding motility-associated C-terminal domain-containing protein [Prevotellaceae bacterium]|jgi:hypothetical protein|nr:gliding motility-associated C-terminal domain-containing protein [Prevotellaceae bacterium]